MSISIKMTQAQRKLAQAEVHKTRAIFGAIRALTLAALGDEIPVIDVQRELSAAAGEVSKMDNQVGEALEADEQEGRPFEPGKPRGTQRKAARRRGRQ